MPLHTTTGLLPYLAILLEHEGPRRHHLTVLPPQLNPFRLTCCSCLSMRLPADTHPTVLPPHPTLFNLTVHLPRMLELKVAHGHHPTALPPQSTLFTAHLPLLCLSMRWPADTTPPTVLPPQSTLFRLTAHLPLLLEHEVAHGHLPRCLHQVCLHTLAVRHSAEEVAACKVQPGSSTQGSMLVICNITAFMPSRILHRTAHL